MTEQTAWKAIAQAYEVPRGVRTREETYKSNGGICGALSKTFVFRFRRGEDLLRYNHMKNEVVYMVEDTPRAWTDWFGGRYFCGLSPANDQLRADFCWFQYFRCGGK